MGCELGVESCGLRLTTEYTKSTEGKGEAESFPLQRVERCGLRVEIVRETDVAKYPLSKCKARSRCGDDAPSSHDAREKRFPNRFNCRQHPSLSKRKGFRFSFVGLPWLTQSQIENRKS